MSTETTPAQARARLSHALTSRPRRGTALITALFIVLGFVAALQFASPDDALDRASRTDLIQILDSLDTRSDQLSEEISRLEASRSELLAGADSSEAAQAEAEARLEALGILAGTVAAEGPGVELGIFDPAGTVDGSAILSVVQELRDAGAEAIQIDGSQRSVRVVASTAFVDVPSGGVSVGGVALSPPYSVLAIGDPGTLAPALRIPGGAVSALEGAGATVSVRDDSIVVVDALQEASAPSYAQPAEPEEAEPEDG
jgi:uncharacterized protein YlxW (UPF0749 family)